MDWVVDLANQTPAVFTVTVVVVVTGLAGMVAYRALKEGREVSFWPPRIGQRPTKHPSVDEEPSANQSVTAGGSIRKVMLPIDQIAYLSLVSGSEPGSAWPITSGCRSFSVGRGKGSDVYLPAELSMSQPHFNLYVQPVDGARTRSYRFFVHDTGSANGTFVNGQRVRYEPYEVEDKDMIEAGGAQFVLHVTSGPSPSKEMAGGRGQTVVVSRSRD
jgi:hypothetical protein